MITYRNKKPFKLEDFIQCKYAFTNDNSIAEYIQHTPTIIHTRVYKTIKDFEVGKYIIYTYYHDGMCLVAFDKKNLAVTIENFSIENKNKHKELI